MSSSKSLPLWGLTNLLAGAIYLGLAVGSSDSLPVTAADAEWRQLALFLAVSSYVLGGAVPSLVIIPFTTRLLRWVWPLPRAKRLFCFIVAPATFYLSCLLAFTTALLLAGRIGPAYYTGMFSSLLPTSCPYLAAFYLTASLLHRRQLFCAPERLPQTNEQA
jgi:hypothetical protein